jgi:hypothetical protein
LVNKKKTKIKVSVGDVFAIPLDGTKYSFGQVVCEGHPKAYVIYNVISDVHPDLKEIISNDIIYFTYTVDVAIEDGNWLLLGNIDVPHRIEFPNYIVDTNEGFFVTDHKGNLIRPANENEVKELDTQKSVSPSILEDAVKANYGFGEWYPYLDKLKYKY